MSMILYLYMITLSGKQPLSELYLLKALAMDGHILSVISDWLLWKSAIEINLVKVLLTLATTAPTDLSLCRLSW